MRFAASWPKKVTMMATTVEPFEQFTKALKRLAKKYPAVLDVVEQLIDDLEANERPGDKIPGVGYDVYKVRLANPSAKKGKSGGFRVIYYVHIIDQVYLIAIYSKSDQSDLPADTIRRLLNELTPPESHERE